MPSWPHTRGKRLFILSLGAIEFGNNGEWSRPRVVQVQFQGIVGAGIEQFRDGSRQTIVWPPELASGQLQFPYAQSVDVNATVF
jgi:branched-chain amino acid transport system substrate-binding protein